MLKYYFHLSERQKGLQFHMHFFFERNMRNLHYYLQQEVVQMKPGQGILELLINFKYALIFFSQHLLSWTLFYKHPFTSVHL